MFGLKYVNTKKFQLNTVIFSAVKNRCMLHAQGPVQFYNLPFPNARSKKNEEGIHWFLTPVDFWKADTILFRNDFTYNLNGCGDHPYAGVLSRGGRLPKIRQCTLEGGYLRNFMTGVCGPDLEDTPYSYKCQAQKPYLFI